MLHARRDGRGELIGAAKLQNVAAVVIRNVRVRMAGLDSGTDLELPVAEPAREYGRGLVGRQVILIDGSAAGRDEQAVVGGPERKATGDGSGWKSGEDGRGGRGQRAVAVAPGVS